MPIALPVSHRQAIMPIQISNPAISGTSAGIKSLIRREALALGFDQIGFTGPTLPQDHRDDLNDFIAKDYHGSMQWMADRLHHRYEPAALWPECRSVIVLGMNYGPDTDPLYQLQHKSNAAISVYALGDDYHDVIKKKLKILGRWMGAQYQTELKVFVDTAPVPEKRLAQEAGLGWQGKHTNIVSRSYGSWLFLGAIYTRLELEPDTRHREQCGSCRACLDICPTDAFPKPFQLDARKCLSYLTIEHKGPWPDNYRRAMGNRIYGCDDCLAVCPWNKFASQTQEAKLKARENLKQPSLADLLMLDDAAFRTLFRKNPIKRIGLHRFLRNCLYAAGNSQDKSLIPLIKSYLSHTDIVVSDAADWALKQYILADRINPAL